MGARGGVVVFMGDTVAGAWGRVPGKRFVRCGRVRTYFVCGTGLCRITSVGDAAARVRGTPTRR